MTDYHFPAMEGESPADWELRRREVMREFRETSAFGILMDILEAEHRRAASAVLRAREHEEWITCSAEEKAAERAIRVVQAFCDKSISPEEAEARRDALLERQMLLRQRDRSLKRALDNKMSGR